MLMLLVCTACDGNGLVSVCPSFGGVLRSRQCRVATEAGAVVFVKTDAHVPHMDVWAREERGLNMQKVAVLVGC